MIIYPDKPWTDGQEFSFILSNGTYVVGIYNAAKNAWSLQRVLPETLNVRPPIFSDNPPTVILTLTCLMTSLSLVTSGMTPLMMLVLLNMCGMGLSG